MTMLVECAIEDFSDPEAVSGSSTNQKLVVFCCKEKPLKNRGIFRPRKEPATASKAGSLCGVWSYIFFGFYFCFWLLCNICVQKLLL